MDQVEREVGGTRLDCCFVAFAVCSFCECHLRALPQCLFSRRSNLPVAVNHLHQQPELQADDGDVHHHLGQDGRHAAGHWGDGESREDESHLTTSHFGDLILKLGAISSPKWIDY